MKDQNKTKKQLMDELARLRQLVGELEILKKEREQTREELEGLVEEQTEELRTTVEELQREMSDCRQMEEDLRREHDLLNRITETSPAGITMLDQEGNIVFANAQAERVLGLTKDEITQRSYNAPEWRITTYDGDPFPDGDLPFQRVIATGLPVYDVRHAIEWPDGRRVMLSVNAAPLFNGQGKTDGMVATVEDITDRRRMEDLLRSERDLGLSLSSTTGLDDTLRLCLDTAIRLSEMDSGGIYLVDGASGSLDLVFHKGLSPDFVKSVSHYDAGSAHARLVLGGKSVYTCHRELGVPLNNHQYREGLRAIGVIPMRYEDRVIGCLNIASHSLDDVPNTSRTALEIIATLIGNAIVRSKAEEALKRSEANLSALIENTNDFICSVDPEYRILTFNRAFRKMFSRVYKTELKEGMRIIDCFPPERRSFWEDSHSRALKGERLTFEYYRVQEGLSADAEVATNPIISQDGTITGVSYFFRDITKRKQTEEALRKSEANLSALIENTNDWICSVDSEYRILTVNKVLKKMFSLVYKTELGEGMRIIDHFPPERRSFWAGVHERALRGDHFTFEDHHEQEGLAVDVEVSTNPIISQDGSITGVSYFFRDITERKRAEETLRESQELYHSLFDGVPVGLYRTMPRGEILDANLALQDMLGYPDRDSLLTVNLVDLYANPEDRKRWEALMEGEEIVRGFEAPFRRYDGAEIWIRDTCRAVRQGNGRALYHEGMIEDITERKQTEERLRKSQQLLAKTFSSLRDAVFIFAAGTTEIIDCNPAASEIFGHSREDMVGRRGTLLHIDEAAYMEFRRHLYLAVKEKGFLSSFEYTMKRKNGAVFPTEQTVTPLEDEQGRRVGWVSVVHDITERKRAEEALRKSEETDRQLSQENAIIAEIGRIISSTLNMDEVYERFAEKVREIIPFDRIAINTVSVRNDTSTVSYITGLEIPERRGGDVFPLAGTLSGEVARRRRSILIQGEDWREFGDGFPKVLLASGAGLRSLMAVPLISKDEVIGVLHFDSRRPNAYSEKDLKLAEKVSGQIAGAIANAQLFVERKRAEEQLRNSRGQLRALASHLQSVREEERTLVAREIHDELGQELTGLKMDLSWLDKRLPAGHESLVEKVESMSRLVDTTIQSVRRISTKLRPGVLDDLGLVAAIEWQAQDFQNRTGIECEFHSSLGELDIDRNRSTTIFRILQETLTNVARHAGASLVTIFLTEEAGDIVLIVEDNGRGIKDLEISDSKSLGLLGMRERALAFGGEVKIAGVPGKKTTVTLRIPVGSIHPVA